MSETQTTTETPIEVNDDLDVFATDFFGQKKDASSQASEETEQDNSTETTVEETEPQETEPNLEDELPNQETPKKKTFQDRINELVKQREDEKRASDARVEALRKEFDERIASLTPKQPTVKSSEPTPIDQNDDGTDKYPLGEFDPLYIRDLTRYTLQAERAQADQQAAEARQKQETETAQANLTAKWNEKLEPAKVQYPDFVEKGQELFQNFSGLDQNYERYLSNLIMSMDKGPDVLYYLASNPAEAVQIVNSGAQRATLALGRIEAKFVDADAQKQLAKPKLSNAPPPPPQSRGSAAGKMPVQADTDDLRAFEKEFFKKAK